MTEKIKDIKSTKERLVDFLEGKIANGVEALDAEEVGEVTDMIKDLAEAEKACWEAAYYESVVEAMKNPEGETGEAMGYDNWRYASGRFAPAGRGTRRGYMPPYMDGQPDYYSEISDGMMGYTDAGGAARGASMNGRESDRRGYTGDPMDELSQLWHEADHDTKRRMKSALEEMSRSLGE